MSILAVDIIKEFLFPGRPQNAVPAMDGPWKPNSKLDQYPALLDALKAPDDLAVDDSGNVYISSGLQVLRLDAPEYKNSQVFAEFSSQVGGLNWDPNLGLMVCVNGDGVHFKGGDHEGLVIREADGHRILAPTATLVMSPDVVIIADASLHHTFDKWVWDLMEKRPSGRLIEFNLVDKSSKTLRSSMAYPAGLAKSSMEDASFLVTEAFGNRLSLANLSPGGLQLRTVLSNLAGYPCRIISRKNGYWLCFSALRTQLVEFVLSEDAFRQEMIKTVDPEFWICPALRATGHCYEPLQGGGIKQLGVMKPWAPPRAYGLIAALNSQLEVIQSYHSRHDGQRHGITGLASNGNSIFAASQGSGVVIQIPAEMNNDQ
jgi:hypothetical protein